MTQYIRFDYKFLKNLTKRKPIFYVGKISINYGFIRKKTIQML